MRIWKTAAVALVAIWVVAGVAIFFSRAIRPTPESLAAYIRDNPIEGLTPDRRAGVIEGVADRLNRLTFEQRQQLRETRIDRKFFEQMTPDERRAFLESTLPEGFRQLMLALNKMKPEERKRIVNRALDDISRDSPEIAERIEDEDARKMLSEGLGAFYEDASADVKLDFAPVIEKLQQATQGMR